MLKKMGHRSKRRKETGCKQTRSKENKAGRTVSRARSRREEESQGHSGDSVAHLQSEKCKLEPERVGVRRQVVTQIGRTGVLGEELDADKQAQTRLLSLLPNLIWSSVWGPVESAAVVG